jgi:hypothetical protein
MPKRMRTARSSRGLSETRACVNYNGSERDPRWISRVSKLPTRGWKSLNESPAPG